MAFEPLFISGLDSQTAWNSAAARDTYITKLSRNQSTFVAIPPTTSDIVETSRDGAFVSQALDDIRMLKRPNGF